jgi:hypothetical protein
MRFGRMAALATTLLLGTTMLATTGPAAAARAHRAAAHTQIKLVGLTGNGRLVFNDHHADRVYLVNSDGTGLRLLLTKAKATHVAGHLVEYRSLTGASDRSRYLDVNNGVSKPVPAGWHWMTPDGGIRFAHRADGWHLVYSPISGAEQDWGVLADAPSKRGVISVVATTDGIVVVVNHEKATKPPAIDFFPDPAKKSHSALDLTGAPIHNGVQCVDVTETISCRDLFVDNHVIGLDPTGAHKPTVAKVSGTVASTMFRSGSMTTYAYTVYTRFFDTRDGCPCTLHFSNGATIKHLGSARILSGDTHAQDIYFVERRHGRDLGIFRGTFGSTHATRIVHTLP